jgi:hypothetical protein
MYKTYKNLSKIRRIFGAFKRKAFGATKPMVSLAQKSKIFASRRKISQKTEGFLERKTFSFASYDFLGCKNYVFASFDFYCEKC